MAEKTLVTHQGSKLTPWMLYVLLILDAEMWRLFRVHVILVSGIRTFADQVRIFLMRYVTAANIRGRRVYDTRVWKGVRYYRIDPTGTVAQPGTSNHEIQGGDTAAWDLKDTGTDPGLTAKNSKRGKWFREVFMPKYGMDPEGDGFAEGWHSRIRNIWKTPPALPAGETEDDVVTAADIEKIAKRTAELTWGTKPKGSKQTVLRMIHTLWTGRRWGKKGEWPHGDATMYEYQNLAALRGEVAGLTEAVKQLAGGKIDPAAITAAVTKAVEAGMADVEITLKSSEG